MTPANFDRILTQVVALAKVVADGRDTVALAILREGHSRRVKSQVRALYRQRYELRGLCAKLWLEATPTESQENFIRRMRGVEPR
jgi:hypothetical protein